MTTTGGRKSPEFGGGDQNCMRIIIEYLFFKREVSPPPHDSRDGLKIDDDDDDDGDWRSSPLDGRRNPSDDRRIGFRVFPGTWRHHRVPVDNVSHLLAKRVGRQLRSLFGRPVPATGRVPRVVPAQQRGGRRRRRRKRRLRLSCCRTVGVRCGWPAARRRCLRPAERRCRMLLLSRRLGGGTVPAERRLLRAGRLFSASRTAAGRPRHSRYRWRACNQMRNNDINYTAMR